MKKQKLKYWLIIILVSYLYEFSYTQDVVINEVMYANQDFHFDADNNSPDWIELYNKSERAINLKGYQLTDDTTETENWIFPDYNLAAGEFLVIFASGKNRKETTEFHTNFKLRLMKEPVFLLSPNGGIVSHYEIQCVPANLSLGYITDGFGELHVQEPSPGKTNLESAIITINYQPDELTFSKQSGFYENEFELSISSIHSENKIHYTTDGSEAELESDQFSSPLLVKDKTPEENVYANIKTASRWQKPGNNIFKATPVRAIVYSAGCPASKEIINTYFIHPQIKNKYKVPVVSLITDPDDLFDDDEGIYVEGNHQNSTQLGKDWERDAHIEYWGNSDNKAIKQNIGVRIHGRGSRSAPRKTLRLYAREEYGDEYFEYSFFKDKKQLTKFKTLLLRASFDQTGSLFVDALCHDLVSDMDIDYQSAQTVVLFINGEYWGLHSLRERQDADYINNNYETEVEDLDIISYEPTRGPEVAEGSINAYDELIYFLENNDLSNDHNYEQAHKLVDVSNLIDYYIAQLYFANWDFPNNNIKFWRENESSAKWRTFFFDCDMCMIRSNYEHLTEYLTDYENLKRYQDWSTVIFRSFLQNKEFRNEFALRYYTQLNKAFRPDVVINKINEYEKLYEPLIAEHTYRWHEPVDVIKWRENVDMLRLFALQRPIAVNKQLEKLIENPFSVFPNPTKDGFYISNTLNDELTIGTQIITLNGNVVYSDNQEIAAKSKSYIEPVLKNGFYLVKISYGGFSFISKLIKL